MKLSTKKLGTKLLFYSILTVLIPILILGVIATNTVKDSMEVQGQDAIEKDLGISEAMFEEHIEKLELFTNYNSKNSEIIEDIEELNYYDLSKIASTLGESAGADFVGFTDSDGNVI
ncbi:sensory transduction histidine kinase [Methanococcus maripaludis C5]|uniref:Sensory transduction histidine kinase n=1 Tax=Methanococcus maripaludis (strain C5 / ATCC BAA-1333) TaxID=402880 RepID=A4G0A6_METM5|nr:sensory transduction histidine kinase [Methanococcus maripaludis C5]